MLKYICIFEKIKNLFNSKVSKKKKKTQKLDQPLSLRTIYLTFCWNYAKIYLYFWKNKK